MSKLLQQNFRNSNTRTFDSHPDTNNIYEAAGSSGGNQMIAVDADRTMLDTQQKAQDVLSDDPIAKQILSMNVEQARLKAEKKT